MKKRWAWLVVIFTIGLLALGLVGFRNKAPSISTENEVSDPELLESFHTNRAEYESAFASVNNQSTRKVAAGIVSHHFLAKDLIADFFAGIDPTEIETIYVVGPDHFSALKNGGQFAVSTLLNWQTPYGILVSDQNSILSLVATGEVTIDNRVFYNEHAIYTLVPFIKRSMSSVKIVPIVLAINMSDEDAYELGQQLVSENAVLIVSSDFAHHVTVEEAKSLDEKSISGLRDLQLDSLDSITDDCRQCLVLLAGYLSDQSATFELMDNKISADYGPARLDDLTTYISAYYRL